MEEAARLAEGEETKVSYLGARRFNTSEQTSTGAPLSFWTK